MASLSRIPAILLRFAVKRFGDKPNAGKSEGKLPNVSLFDRAMNAFTLIRFIAFSELLGAAGLIVAWWSGILSGHKVPEHSR